MATTLKKAVRKTVRGTMVGSGAALMTLALFLLLPLIQAIGEPPHAELELRSVDTAYTPPPPPIEEQPEDEPEPDEAPPELQTEAQTLDLAQLELALNPGLGAGSGGAEFAMQLDTKIGGAAQVDALFSMAELDQKPRAVYQPHPNPSPQTRKHAPGQVYVIFIVDQDGRVQQPVVQSSTDPVFEKPALDAVKQWRFESGKRKGKAVRFRMRVPITFPG